MTVDCLKSRVKKAFPYLCVLTVFWLIVFIIVAPWHSDNVNNQYLQRINRSQNTVAVVGELTEGIEVTQSFVASESNLKDIQVLVATYARSNVGIIHATIQNDDGNIIYDKEVNVAEWEDNSFYTFAFEPQRDSKNKKYTLTFRGIDGVKESSPTLWLTNPEEDTLTGIDPVQLNGIEQGLVLIMNATYNMNMPQLKLFYLVCWFILIALSYVFTLTLNQIDEKVFLRFCICLGSLFIIMNPFYHILDEMTHFFRSLCISQNEWIDTIQDGKIGAYIASNADMILQFQSINLKSLCIPAIEGMHFSAEKAFYVHPYMSAVVPINHAIPAVGIFIARVLNLNVAGVIYFGRLANYIYYVILCYLAIKNAKYYKSFYFVIAVLPMSQWLAASYSIDSVLLGNSLLFVSICFKYRFDEEIKTISIVDILLLLWCGMGIASVKYCVYTPILLVFFLIPRKCFPKKQYVITIVLAVLVVLGMGIWQIDLLRRFPFTEDRNGYVNVGEQIVFIKQNIGYTIRNFISYFVMSMNTLPSGLFVVSTIPAASHTLSFIAVFSATLAPDKYAYKKKWEKSGMIFLSSIIVIIVYGLTIAALYVGYTPVGTYGVDGVQSRYILPILLFIMICLSTVNVKNEIFDYAKKLTFMMELSVLLSLSEALMESFLN